MRPSKPPVLLSGRSSAANRPFAKHVQGYVFGLLAVVRREPLTASGPRFSEGSIGGSRIVWAGVTRAATFTLCFLACVLYGLPGLNFILSGVNGALFNPEFSFSRYFAALGVLRGAPASVTEIVQGFPMGILQTLIAAVLGIWEPAQIASMRHVHLFSVISLAAAYALGCVALLLSWQIRSMTILDKVILSVSVLAIWPLSGQNGILYFPDYWIFEPPFVILGAALSISLIREYQREGLLPAVSNHQILLYGLFIAVCFCQKPSLALAAITPAALRIVLATRGSIPVIRLLLRLGCAIFVFHALIILTYYSLGGHFSFESLRSYYDWFASGGASRGAPASTIAAGLGDLVLDRHYASIRVFAIAVSLIMFVCAGVSGGMREKGQIMLAVLITAGVVVHIVVNLLRFGPTSQADFSFFSASIVPMACALMRTRTRASIVWIGGSLIAGAIVSFKLVGPPEFVPWADWGPTRSEHADILAASEQVDNYVRELKRPVVYIADANDQGPSIFLTQALVYGHVGQEPIELGAWPFSASFIPRVTADSFHQRLFPETYVVTGHSWRDRTIVKNAIAMQWAVLWSAKRDPAQPDARELLPELNGLFDSQHAVVREYPIGDRATNYVGFLKDSPAYRGAEGPEIRVDNYLGDGATLSWVASNEAAVYLLEQSVDDQPFELAEAIPLAAAEQQDGRVVHFVGGLGPDHTYRFRIHWRVGTFESVDSPIVVVPARAPLGAQQGPTTAPAMPEGLVALVRSNGDILLTWTPVRGSSAIRVERKDGPTAEFREIGVTGPGSSGHLNTGLTRGSTYSWRVRACNALGCSAYTAELSETAS